MFEYVQVIAPQSKVTVGYVNYSLNNNELLVKVLDLKNLTSKQIYRLPLKEISDISKKEYQGWKRIEFTYQGLKFVFIYSGFGEYDYFKRDALFQLVDNHL